ncbi:protein of unknown function [Streptococcus thermophilus]|nr:protein of unknown function [Streptococcus thermophilus]CAD0145248.1 protein of unknown function [Streptococcus thermophilus]
MSFLSPLIYFYGKILYNQKVNNYFTLNYLYYTKQNFTCQPKK